MKVTIIKGLSGIVAKAETKEEIVTIRDQKTTGEALIYLDQFLDAHTGSGLFEQEFIVIHE